MPNSWKWFRRVLALMLLGVVAGGVGWLAWQRHSPVVNGGLEIPAEALALGEVWENSHLEWTLPLHNPTGQDVVIQEFVRSCFCMEITPPKVTVPAGKTVPLHLLLDVRRRSPSEEFAVRFAPLLAGRLRPEVGWLLSGRVRRWLYMESPQVDIGEYVLGEETAHRCSIRLRTDPAVRQLHLLAEETPCLEATLYRSSKSATEWELQIVPRANLPAGFFTTVLHIQATFADGHTARLPAVAVAGWAQPPVALLPGELLLGPQELGQRVTEEVQVWSRRQRPVHVQRLEGAAPDVQIELLPAQGSKQILRLHVAITQPGSQSRQVAVLVREEGGSSEIRLPLVVQYYGRRTVPVAAASSQEVPR
jgi:hypothetical protein